MKYFDWNEEKNNNLKIERDVCYEDVVAAINDGKLLVTLNHPNKLKHPNQKMYVVNIDDYAYVVPFIEDQKKYFLKTIYPSRKMTKQYIIKEKP